MKRSSLPDSSDSDEISFIEGPTPKKSPAGRTMLGHLGKDEKTQNKGEDLGILVWEERFEFINGNVRYIYLMSRRT